MLSYAMDLRENKYNLNHPFGNNQPGADKLVNMIAELFIRSIKT